MEGGIVFEIHVHYFNTSRMKIKPVTNTTFYGNKFIAKEGKMFFKLN